MKNYKAIDEKRRELLKKYKYFTQWVDEYTKDIIESERGRNQLFEIARLESEISLLEKEESEVREYHSCNHPDKYRFTDREGFQRCSSCHGYIEDNNNRKG